MTAAATPGPAPGHLRPAAPCPESCWPPSTSQPVSRAGCSWPTVPSLPRRSSARRVSGPALCHWPPRWRPGPAPTPDSWPGWPGRSPPCTCSQPRSRVAVRCSSRAALAGRDYRTAHASRDQPFSACGARTAVSASRQGAATGSVRCPSSAASRSAAEVSSEGMHLRGSPSPASP